MGSSGGSPDKNNSGWEPRACADSCTQTHASPYTYTLTRTCSHIDTHSVPLPTKSSPVRVSGTKDVPTVTTPTTKLTTIYGHYRHWLVLPLYILHTPTVHSPLQQTWRLGRHYHCADSTRYGLHLLPIHTHSELTVHVSIVSCHRTRRPVTSPKCPNCRHTHGVGGTGTDGDRTKFTSFVFGRKDEGIGTLLERGVSHLTRRRGPSRTWSPVRLDSDRRPGWNRCGTGDVPLTSLDLDVTDSGRSRGVRSGRGG